jgi:hypothetical protein
MTLGSEQVGKGCDRDQPRDAVRSRDFIVLPNGRINIFLSPRRSGEKAEADSEGKWFVQSEMRGDRRWRFERHGKVLLTLLLPRFPMAWNRRQLMTRPA